MKTLSMTLLNTAYTQFKNQLVLPEKVKVRVNCLNCDSSTKSRMSRFFPVCYQYLTYPNLALSNVTNVTLNNLTY